MNITINECLTWVANYLKEKHPELELCDLFSIGDDTLYNAAWGLLKPKPNNICRVSISYMGAGMIQFTATKFGDSFGVFTLAEFWMPDNERDFLTVIKILDK
jgi:hypothetical protein